MTSLRNPAFFIVLLQIGALGVGNLFGSLYDFPLWSSWCLASAGLLAGLIIAGRRPATRSETIVLACATGLAVWAATSMLWAESVEDAWREALRFGAYAVILALAVLGVRGRHQALVAVAAVAGALVGLGAIIEAQLLTGESDQLFQQGRLAEPIGYANGLGGAMAMGAVMSVSFAASPIRAWLSGSLMAAAILLSSLLVLTQSRGALAAVVVALLVLVLAAPRRLARCLSVVVLVGGAAAALPWTLDVFSEYSDQSLVAPRSDSVRRAGFAALAAAVGGGIAWWLGRRAEAVFGGPRLRAATGGMLAIGLSTAVLVTLVSTNPIAWVEQQYRNFASDEPVSKETRVRFTAATSKRHDLWRVAVKEFADAPIRGLGAANYPTRYYELRRQDNTVRQPHSLPLQILAELGIVGALISLALVVTVAMALLRRVRHDPTATVALGAIVVWAGHTSLDWLFNLPALTGLALIATGAALAGTASAPRGAPRWTPLGLAAVVLVAVLAAGTGRLLAAERYRSAAEGRVAGDPRRALSDIDASLRLDPASVESRYLQAAAHARLSDYPRARRALLQAVRLEPHNHVPWGLLGDLATRRGQPDTARRAYARAARLNPFDAALARLAARRR